MPLDEKTKTLTKQKINKCCLGHYTTSMVCMALTHWGRETHICVSKLTSIVSDNGLSPGRRQAIIWTNAGILLIGPLGTNSREILIRIRTFWFIKTHLKMSSGKWRPFCLGLNVLKFRQPQLGSGLLMAQSFFPHRHVAKTPPFTLLFSTLLVPSGADFIPALNPNLITVNKDTIS